MKWFWGFVVYRKTRLAPCGVIVPSHFAGRSGWGPVVPGVCTVHRLVLAPTVKTLGPYAALCTTIKFLFDDPEVQRAALEAETLAGKLNSAHPRLDAYSDGGVAGSGAEGSGTAIIRFEGTDITLNIRLVPVGRRLSSGRAEWVGLLLILAVLRRVKATATVRLGNIQVVNLQRRPVGLRT